jgi:hypothetical protein
VRVGIGVGVGVGAGLGEGVGVGEPPPTPLPLLDGPLPLLLGKMLELLLLVPEQELVREMAEESTRMDAALETAFEAKLMLALIPESP